MFGSRTAGGLCWRCGIPALQKRRRMGHIRQNDAHKHKRIRGRVNWMGKRLRGGGCFGPGHRHRNFNGGAAVFIKQLAARGFDDRFSHLPDSVTGFFTGCN